MRRLPPGRSVGCGPSVRSTGPVGDRGGVEGHEIPSVVTVEALDRLEGLGPHAVHLPPQSRELAFELEDAPDPLQVQACGGEVLDAPEPREVALGEAARPTRRPRGIEQALALVHPQRLGVDACKLCGNRDHVDRCGVVPWGAEPRPGRSGGDARRRARPSPSCHVFRRRIRHRGGRHRSIALPAFCRSLRECAHVASDWLFSRPCARPRAGAGSPAVEGLSPSVAASCSTAARCSSVNDFGTTTSMRTRRSPGFAPLRPPPAGTPRPRTLSWVPGAVPAGTRSVTGPSRVGTVTVVPSVASGNDTGTESVRFRPRRPKRGSRATRTTTYRSPGGALPGPGAPLPLTRIRWPSSTPGGMRTLTVRLRRSVPVPWHVGHGVSTTVPRPLHCGQIVDSEKRPWLSSSVPSPLHLGQVCVLVPGAAPDPLQVWHRASSGTLTDVVTPWTASVNDRWSSVSTSAPR